MLEFYEPQADYGTPESTSIELVTLSIDGVEVTVPEGTSVMRAAAESGVKVPRLCATDQLKSFGSCRVCLVEIEGRRGFPASCTTTVEAGMEVKTQSDEIAKLRRNVMELYISDHPLDCLTCPTNGDCELQDTAGELGLRPCATALKARTIWWPRKTSPTPISPLIHPSALSAHAVCAPVKKCRAPLP